MFKTEEQHAHLKRSPHNASLIDPGPPVIYRLNTKRTYIDETEKVRKWTFGQKGENKSNKVILMVGETGAGKTTMINTMVNYLLGVKFEDEEFYQITDEAAGKKREDKEEEKDQSQSQTSKITVYEVFVEKNPMSLTIIDTPGYAHSDGFDKDQEIAKDLVKLFSDKDGINHIDAVCFVMKSSQNRLSEKELYIFHSVLSLFGRDIENNIVFLLTQSHGGPHGDALNAIKKAEIPCRKDEDNEPVHFLFNNQQKEKRIQKYMPQFKSYWEMGEGSITNLFTLLEDKNRKSVQMTLHVLKERMHLEACVSNLVDRILENECEEKRLTQVQEALRQNRDKIQKCENFQFTVNKFFKERVPIKLKWWPNKKATCCTKCQENCHYWNCWWANDPSECWVMSNDHCTVCTRKCHHSMHVKEDKTYMMIPRNVTMTFDDLKQEYECNGDIDLANFDKQIYENTKTEFENATEESVNKTKIEINLTNRLSEIKKEKSSLLCEAFMTISSLSKIALKTDSAFTLQYVEFLIDKMKEEGKDDMMKELEDLMKTGEKQKNKGAIRYVLSVGAQKFSNFFSYIGGKGQ